MTKEEAIKALRYERRTALHENKSAFDMAIKALSAEPCRETDDYENEIADLQNRLDIAEYDRDRWKERVTVLEEKLKALSAEPCEDCISRQAALDKAGYTETEEGWSGMTVDVKDIESLPSVTPKQKMGRWIPISERLPEDRYAVLVWCPERRNIYCAYLEENQWQILGAYQKVTEYVDAWMPLPESYKAESEGRNETDH